MELTAIMNRDGAGYVALCPQLDIASQGSSVELALENLREAIELFAITPLARAPWRRTHDRLCHQSTAQQPKSGR